MRDIRVEDAGVIHVADPSLSQAERHERWQAFQQMADRLRRSLDKTKRAP